MAGPGGDRFQEPERLLAQALTEADPVPEDVTAYAKAIHTWRSIDAELASLSMDTTVDQPAGVRGGGAVRFVFSDPSGTTIELDYEPGNRTLDGDISPKGSGDANLMTPASTAEGFVQGGRFGFDEVPRGPIALVVRLDDGRALKTEWITL